MSVSSVGSAGAQVASAPPSPPSQEIGQEEFLNLLMAQLANQDPLNPLDSAQFIDQVASMNQVQQLVGANDRLDALMLGLTSLNNQSAVDLVGEEVVARGDTVRHEAGASHELRFDLAGQAEHAKVTVKDAAGNVVWEAEMTDLLAGENKISWPGVDAGGKDVAPGDYTFEVAANAEGGTAVDATLYITGRVEELRFDQGFPVLLVGGEEVTLDGILRVLDAPDPPFPISSVPPHPQQSQG